MTSPNVVRMWRHRTVHLGRVGWGCAACGRTFLVYRRVCPRCGSTLTADRVPLPRQGTVLALTSAGIKVEHLDQATTRQVASLLELTNGARLACLVSHADSGQLLPGLRGVVLRLAIRRLFLGPMDVGLPIPYGPKAAADIRTRIAAKAATNPGGLPPSRRVE